jgi:hypothetical protein
MHLKGDKLEEIRNENIVSVRSRVNGKMRPFQEAIFPIPMKERSFMMDAIKDPTMTPGMIINGSTIFAMYFNQKVHWMVHSGWKRSMLKF